MSEDTGVRLRDGEQVVLALRRTSWLATAIKLVTLGLYVPWWRASWFVLTDHRLIAKQGILNKTEIALPLHFAQDASVHRTWLGVGRVEVSTAGGDVGSLCLEPLTAQDARALADAILSQAKRIRLDIGAPQATVSGDVSEALLRLANLRESGALTDDEFSQQKARLLEH
jgi:uncharacterized membrane protein YdbT with pleckstrin-like domain